jgi:hypothetical protein
MSTAAKVVLHPKVQLPDGRPSTGNFQTWGFAQFLIQYRIDELGRLLLETLGDDGSTGLETRPLPCHGFLTFEEANSRHQYTARFTYGLLDGIKTGGEEAWTDEHTHTTPVTTRHGVDAAGE